MKKQDRQGVRTVSDLERKYAIGQSFKKAQGGIQKATEDANQAKEQAKNANAGLEDLEKSVQEAKSLAENAADAAFRAENKVDCMGLTVENGETTAKIILKVEDIELPVTIDMQGLATVENLKTHGAAQIHGENIFGKILSADGESLVIDLDTGAAVLTGSFTTEKQWDEDGNCRHAQVSPEGVHVRWLTADENGEEAEAARAELTPTALVFPLGNGRVSGLAQPEEAADAVNKSYLEAYVAQELDKLRAELGLNDGE